MALRSKQSMSQVIIKTLSVLLVLIASVPGLAQTNQGVKQTALDQRVRAELSQFKGKVSVYAKNLDTGEIYELGGNDRVSTASTIKIAIMVEAFARVSDGKAKATE